MTLNELIEILQAFQPDYGEAAVTINPLWYQKPNDWHFISNIQVVRSHTVNGVEQLPVTPVVEIH